MGMQARLGFEAELSTALEERQFFLLYQPILDLSTHEVVGVEALIRWQHPTRGVVTPHSFIGLAKSLGVRLALDDFGTGYASLSHLQRMPVDILKIDRSFVAALNDGGRSRDLLEAILDMAGSLSLEVIAEGVEDQAQLTVLEQLGCQMAQGYLLGQPVPPQDIETLLASRQLGLCDFVLTQ